MPARTHIITGGRHLTYDHQTHELEGWTATTHLRADAFWRLAIWLRRRAVRRRELFICQQEGATDE